MNEVEKKILYAACDHLEIAFKLAIYKEADLKDDIIDGHLQNIKLLKENALTWNSSIQKTVKLAIKCYKRELEKSFSKMDNEGKNTIQLELSSIKNFEIDKFSKEEHTSNMMALRSKFSLSSIKASIGLNK